VVIISVVSGTNDDDQRVESNIILGWQAGKGLLLARWTFDRNLSKGSRTVACPRIRKGKQGRNLIDAE